MTMNKRARAGSDRWSDIKGGMAFVIPLDLIRHESYRLMTPWAHKLLADLSGQYTGYNNGYLCAAWKLMERRGWNSRTTLAKTAAELEHFRMLERTQQGGRNKPNLYAFTWRRVDRIDGRPLDVSATLKPSNAWDAKLPRFEYKPRKRRRNGCPPDGLDDELQAHDLDSVCPLNGPRDED
jgi:hypothetical protein